MGERRRADGPDGARARSAAWRGAAASVVLAASVLGGLGPTLPAEAADQAAIPVAEIAMRAAAVPNRLRALSEHLTPSAEIETIRKRLPEVRRRIELELAAAAGILQGQPTLDMLQAQQQLWQRRQLQTTGWLSVLTLRATLLQEALGDLADIRRTWRQTRDAARASGAPGPVLLQIDSVLAAVDAAETPLAAQRIALLDLQSVVAPEVARSETALAQFTQAQQQAMGGMLVRDSAPMWSGQAWARARDTLRAHVRDMAAGRWGDIDQYVRDPDKGLPRHIGILLVLTLMFVAARRRARRPATAEEGESAATAVFDRPYAAALAVTLFLTSSPISVAPSTVRDMFQVLALLPVIRLARPMVDRRLAPELYLLMILFALDGLRQTFFDGAPVLEPAILTLEMAAGIAVLAYSLTTGGLRRPPPPLTESGRLRAFRAGARLVLLLLAVALVAGAAGHMRLARLLASGVLGHSALALTLYAGILVAVGVAALALRVRPLRLLQMVQHHRDLLERRARHALIWMAIGAWLIRTLDYVGLFQPALSFGQAVLTATLGRGSIQISVGSVLEFVLTVWLAYLVSAFIRFVLREDVYPRTRLTRGITYAISSLLNYVIVALGFVLALGVLGLDLTRVTVLLGAFGVGIGFGLQSVVNNFVSGLILLFERPIHVGDIVEVGDLSGEVSRIGIRASTVRTWQGAEIIVPNAQLVTERVTNWTLSDRTRRIDLRVGVDYGSAPGKVVEVLEAVARAHPEIMQTPAPQGVFTGFGDSSINFELRAWTNRFERWPKIQTELVVGLYAALHAAGMTFPFPQREVRLLRDAPAGPVAPAPPPSSPA